VAGSWSVLQEIRFPEPNARNVVQLLRDLNCDVAMVMLRHPLLFGVDARLVCLRVCVCMYVCVCMCVCLCVCVCGEWGGGVRVRCVFDRFLTFSIYFPLSPFFLSFSLSLSLSLSVCLSHTLPARGQHREADGAQSNDVWFVGLAALSTCL
jgi:hypothetical protein